MVYLWRAIDHEGEILESYITRSSDKAAALRFMKKALKRHGLPEAITTDGLRSSRPAITEPGNVKKARGRTMGKQPNRKQPPLRPKTSTGNVPVSANQKANLHRRESVSR